MAGQEALRTGDLACVFRVQGRRKPKTGLYVEWQGVRSACNIEMPSGRKPLRDEHDSRRAVARILARAAEPIAPHPHLVTINTVEIVPEVERMWRGGRLREIEAKILFAPNLSVTKNRSMVSATVATVGALFLVRALSNGHVEAIPFGFDDRIVHDEFSIGNREYTISFLTAVGGPGFTDTWTNTLLTDLAALRPFDTASRLGEDAGRYLADLLMGPINDSIGGILSAHEDSPRPRRHAGHAGTRAIETAALIIGREILIHWRAPATQHGYPRIEGVTAMEGYLQAEEEDIVQAVFMAAAEPITPEALTCDATSEPGHPWRPKQPASYRFSTVDTSAHQKIADVAELAETWARRRSDPVEAWRFHRPDGRPISPSALARVDRFFGLA